MSEHSGSGSPSDILIGRYLSKRHGLESRRSFLSKLTKVLYGVAGVRVAAVITPLLIPYSAHAQGAGWQRCGLRGHICGTGNCDCPGSVPAGNFCGFGNGFASEWVSCCLNPGTNCYHCCYYRDKVTNLTNLVLPAASGCDGVTPSGAQWGGDKNGIAPRYVCTTISCSGPQGKTLAECKCVPVRTRPFCGKGPKPADS